VSIKPRLGPVAQSLAGITVVLVGVGCAAYLGSGGHTFGAFLALAAMLGALVPLYPPDEKKTDFV